MSTRKPKLKWFLAMGSAALVLAAITSILAQQAPNFLTSVDSNNDGIVTRQELRAAMAKWIPANASNGIDQQQLATALDSAFPASTIMSLFGGGAGPQNQTPNPADVEKMLASLPSQAPSRPARPRKVLVLAKCAGFVHSCIPLAAKTVESLGSKTGAWTTTVSYDPSVINEQNLKQYDAVLLNNTTGAFLDDPKDAGATAARRKALLDFVRSGKGLAGIHAAADSYHQAEAPAAGAPGAARGGGMALGPMIAGGMMTTADKDGNKRLTAQELNGLADTWYDKMDLEKSGKLTRQNLTSRLSGVLFSAPAGGSVLAPAKGRPGRDNQVGTWPEFNKMIGGFFKYHWMDPTHIAYKIDDPNSPLTKMFKGIDFSVDDETYTFGIRSWSRENLHVLTSVDYARMSEADKLKEDYPREDHDYGLSWIRREGQGRVFYEAHGHNERVYAIKPMLEHILAGVQYALGDLKANDSPSVQPKK